MSSGSSACALRDHAAACFGASRAGGQSGYAEDCGAEAEKRIPSSSNQQTFHTLLGYEGDRERSNPSRQLRLCVVSRLK